MYSAYKLNKHGDNIQPWHTPFPIWNQSVVPYPVLTVASWPAYRSQETGQVVWYSHLSQNFPQLIVIHTVKGFGIVNKAEIDVFLELSSFFHDPVDVGNLISGSSAFSKTSLNIRNFMVHTLLKPGLENFEHYFTSMWDECNCVVVWAFFGIAFLWDWNTALSNSMKLSHACGATQDGQVMVERSDRMWSTGESNGKPLQYSCLENPMNSMKRQNVGYWKRNSPDQ